jgi:hypothetical protein
MNKLFASAALVAATLVTAPGCEPTTKSTGVDRSIVSRKIDAQDFTAAAQETTQQMLSAPGVQQKLAEIQRTLPPGQKPLIKISRIRNDTGQKVNLVDYFVTPIESVLVNSGKAETFAEDKTTQSTAAAQDILNGTSPRLAELTLFGVVTKLSTYNDGTDQNVYTFQLRLADARTNSNVFIGQPRQIVKQTR